MSFGELRCASSIFTPRVSALSFAGAVSCASSVFKSRVSAEYGSPGAFEHVLLAAPGENRLLLALDRFLAERGGGLALALEPLP